MESMELLSVYTRMRYTTVTLSSWLLLLCLVVQTAVTAEFRTRESTDVATAPSYVLYTRRNQHAPQQVQPEVESLLRSSFYAMEPIVFLIPSWPSNTSMEKYSAIISALLDREASNVFVVDLAAASSESHIVASVSNLAVLLQQQFAVPLQRQQLVAYAEGAHLAGAVAEQVQQVLGEQLGRITALDPSGDRETSRAHTLSSKDAAYVEVIHTNGEGSGTMTQLGHVDYYPNGGRQQPGCQSHADPDACAHERALDLAIEMWSPANDFISARCGSIEAMSGDNCRWSSLRMGMETTGKAASTGIYFLETHSRSPYGRGAYYFGFL